MHYKILLDEQKFDTFFNFLPELEKDEVYYLSLFGRHKYAQSMPNLRDNQLVRFTSSKEHLREKILRLQCSIGGYRRDGVDVPQEALALYIAANPRNKVKANKELLVELATVPVCITEVPLVWALSTLNARFTSMLAVVSLKTDHSGPVYHSPWLTGI